MSVCTVYLCLGEDTDFLIKSFASAPDIEMFSNTNKRNGNANLERKVLPSPCTPSHPRHLHPAHLHTLGIFTPAHFHI
jgi:hypothetical protein